MGSQAQGLQLLGFVTHNLQPFDTPPAATIIGDVGASRAQARRVEPLLSR